MTNYNDGKFHGWNGGECPVHPQTIVLFLGEYSDSFEATAINVDWNEAGGFKVVTPYIEPREFIVTIAGNGDLSVHRCDNPPSVQHAGCEYLTVREVV